MRLTGFPLRALRAIIERPGAARLVRDKFFADYGIDEVLALGPQFRAPLDVHPGPLEQTTRRGWSGKGLATPSPPPGRTTTADLRRAYADGELTPVEVLSSIRRRIEDQDFGESLFSPFRSLDFERAQEEAQRSALRYQEGKPVGPLDGIPLPIKDQHQMKGLPTSCGTSYLDRPASEDAHLIEVLRDSGALLYAKTRTTEWGMDPCGFCSHQSMPRNAYSRVHGAGGSSTGAGVAVALGLAPVATGSDGGGSIRIPAGLNGVFGIKPTYGRIGRSGDLFGDSTVSASGPLGSSTADLVELLAVAACAEDSADPVRRWGPRQRNLADRWRRALGRGVDGCRIGIPRGEWNELDASLQRPMLDALRQLEADGAELVDLDLPILSYAPAVGMLTIGLETLGNLEDIYATKADHFGDTLRTTLSLLSTVDATEYLRARRTRAAIKKALRDALDTVDIIALPTTLTTAPDYPPQLDRTPIMDEEALKAMTRFTFLANITGLPAGSVPVTLHDGLPLGLQFVGGSFDEASLFAVMAHAERQQWTHLSPAPDYRSPL